VIVSLYVLSFGTFLKYYSPTGVVLGVCLTSLATVIFGIAAALSRSSVVLVCFILLKLAEICWFFYVWIIQVSA